VHLFFEIEEFSDWMKSRFDLYNDAAWYADEARSLINSFADQYIRNAYTDSSIVSTVHFDEGRQNVDEVVYENKVPVLVRTGYNNEFVNNLGIPIEWIKFHDSGKVHLFRHAYNDVYLPVQPLVVKEGKVTVRKQYNYWKQDPESLYNYPVTQPSDKVKADNQGELPTEEEIKSLMMEMDKTTTPEEQTSFTEEVMKNLWEEYKADIEKMDSDEEITYDKFVQIAKDNFSSVDEYRRYLDSCI